MDETRGRPGAGDPTGGISPSPGENPGKRIGAIYRRMSSWYILFSIVLFVVILFVGYRLARPLFDGPLAPLGG